MVNTVWIMNNDTSGSYDSTTTTCFVCHIDLCSNHKICDIIIWHVLFKAHYIRTYRDTGKTEMDSVTESLYLRDHRVHSHHCIMRNTYSSIPSSLFHARLPSVDGSTQCVWFLTPSSKEVLLSTQIVRLVSAGYLFIFSDPFLMLIVPEWQFPNNSVRIVSKVWRSVHDALSGILLLKFTPPGLSKQSDGLRHHDHVNLVAIIISVWRFICRMWLGQFEDALQARNCLNMDDIIVAVWVYSFAGDDHANLEARINWVGRYTCRPWSSEFGDALGDPDRARVETATLRP